MLPDCWDVEDDDVEFAPTAHWGAASFILTELGDFDGNAAGHHCAFGRPDTSYASPVTPRDADGPAVHLLQLAEDVGPGWGWGDGGTVCFTIPAKAFAAGDFSKAEANLRCC
ncbi:DUF1963 domain-containing protein [Kitasatospora griseola]|uniref:DUF1963 domain-containing protein n=1 Tax=Kitasatospora griseola TaxID=2064 RepID=UPI00343301D9